MAAFITDYLKETMIIIQQLDQESIEKVAAGIANVRARNGRLFLLGVGGSAGHASHAVNDFRKICGIEAYCPTDNVSELTARVNDEGWDTTFSEWLKVSRLNDKDGILIFSVGGGNAEQGVSLNLIKAMHLAKEKQAAIFGIVGKDGGHTRQVADASILVPIVNPDRITAHTEGICAILWHLLVSHPLPQTSITKWESLKSQHRA